MCAVKFSSYVCLLLHGQGVVRGAIMAIMIRNCISKTVVQCHATSHKFDPPRSLSIS